MDPMKMMKMKSAMDQFHKTHPRVMPFFKAVQEEGIRPGIVMELKVVTPEGKEMVTNIKVQPSDLELLQNLMGK
ncbi:MAG: hypothetical protein J5983_05420 [Ruminococcus sp.]|nr:hypothetical protein [Ruminococcus sp.]